MEVDQETREKIIKGLDKKIEENFYKELQSISKQDMHLAILLLASPDTVNEILGQRNVLKLIEKLVHIGILAITIHEDSLGSESYIERC